MWMFFVLLFSLCIHTLEIVNHYKPDTKSAKGTLTQDSSISIEHNVESSWLIFIWTPIIKDERDYHVIDHLRDDYIVKKDHCTLLKHRALSKVGFLMRIYCNTAKKTEDGVKQLGYTLRYLKETFGKKNVTIEKNGRRKHHSFHWAGGYEHVDQILKAQKRKKQHTDSTISPYDNLIAFNDRSLWRTKPNTVQSSPTWGLDRIDQRFGLLDSQYTYLNLASSIDIYILDTGIRVTHNDFGGRAIFLSNTVGDGINTDCNGHGTHVAGISGSTTYGVAKNVTLIGVKVLDCNGDGDLFTIQAGVMDVIESAQTREGSTPKSRRSVVNLSLGGTKSSMLDSIIALLTQNGIFVSVSAGNSGADACNYSPAGMGGLNSANHVLSVGASDINDAKPSWSNYGSCVSITAPGKGILSLWYTSNSATAILDGTSMASPYAAGVAALIWEQNRNLTVTEVNQLVQSWVTPNVITGTSSGGGKNLLFSLVVYGQSPPTSAPTAVVVTPPPPPPPMVTSGAMMWLYVDMTKTTIIATFFSFCVMSH
jgi:subtilisin family serine protease